MVNWKVSTSNAQIFFANAQDFLAGEEIPKEIRDSYNAYVIATNPKSLSKTPDGKYYQTTWMETDTVNDAMYDASYHDRFGWSVRKMPGSWAKKEDTSVSAATAATAAPSSSTQTENISAQTGTQIGGFSKSAPTERESLARVVQLLEVIVEYLTEKKGMQKASDM